jgi:hypothetical protein
MVSRPIGAHRPLMRFAERATGIGFVKRATAIGAFEHAAAAAHKPR